MMAWVGLNFCAIMASMFLEGAWFGIREMDILNQLTGYSITQAGDLSVIQLGAGFFTTGLPKMLLWDYPFLQGNLLIVRFLLICLSIGVLWGVFTVLIGAAQSLVQGVLRLFQ